MSSTGASQAMFHQVHTPRQEQRTSSKLGGYREYERKAKRTFVSGSSLFGSHSQGTPKFVPISRISTSYASKQFPWTGMF